MNYFKDAAQLSSVFKKAWQKRENYIERGSLQAFRLITKEELDVPMAVDIYGYDAKPCAVMQQYDFDISDYDLDLLEEILRSEYGVVEIFYKKRFRVKDSPDAGGEINADEFELVVKEYGHYFLVNLSNYLDTGLFLDHRDTRKWVEEMVRERTGANKDFQVLNLFAYTGSFSVYAAAGGASMTHTVDLSKTYCDWARRNMDLNHLAKEQHWIYRMDTFEFYKYAVRKELKFDFIILDPPTFSRNKGDNFGVQRDHYELVMGSLKMLRDGGELLFSNNCLDFVLDWRIKRDFEVKNVQSLTVPVDFRVDGEAIEDDLYRQIHNCFLIKRKSS